MFSRFTGYALKAMAYLADQPPGSFTGAREIAAATGIPIPFLWKVLRHLSRSGLVRSAKGKNGGYELAHPAKRIPLMRVVDATQREDRMQLCVLGLEACDEVHSCAVHEQWSGIREEIENMLARTTVAELATPRKPRRPRRRS